MRGRLFIASVLTAAAGCTAINPAYESNRESSTGPSVATSSTSNAATTAASALDSGSTFDEPDPATGWPGTTAAASSSGGEPACPLDGTALKIEVRDGAGSPIPPNCQQPLASFAVGRVGTTRVGYESTHCGDCECEDPPATEEREVRIEGLRPFDFEDCGRLIVWDDVVGGQCVHAGLALARTAEAPIWVASRTIELPSELGLVPTIDLVDIEPCPTAQCASAGLKALRFGSQTVVEVGESALVSLDGPSGNAYEVFNHNSTIASSCRPAVVWTAERLE